MKSLHEKKVFVTGADGFIGSHLVEALVNQGAKVTALVFYNSWNSIGWLSDIPKSYLDNINIIKGDIRDENFVQNSLIDMDYIFHLASLIAIPYSYVAPNSYVQTNVIGTLNILNASKKNNNLTKLIHTSTSEVYGTAQYVPIDETHPVVGQSPYSASKIGADKLVESFYLSFKLPVVTARPFNTYGPRQTSRAVIPTIISQLLENKTIKLGNLDPTRDFNYVKDTVNGLLSIALSDKVTGKTVNIGSGKEFSIAETVNFISKILGIDYKIKLDTNRVRPADSEVDRLLANNKLIKSLTNWESQTNFKKGLELTISWIQKNKQYFKSGEYSL